MENQNNNEVRLNKIPLKLFIDTLMDVYNSGADFIDLVGKPDIEQDSIGVIVRLEYMNSEETEETNEVNEEEFIAKKLDIKLSDEDLNQLL
jgi:hypothetical protein